MHMYCTRILLFRTHLIHFPFYDFKAILVTTYTAYTTSHILRSTTYIDTCTPTTNTSNLIITAKQPREIVGAGLARITNNCSGEFQQK